MGRFIPLYRGEDSAVPPGGQYTGVGWDPSG